MKFLLKLKHWQLFLLTWGILFVAFPFVAFSVVVPVASLFCAGGWLGWIWAIATVLHEKLPASTHLKVRLFKILFIISIGFIVLGEIAPLDFPGWTVIQLLSSVGLFWGALFAAKTMRSVELGRVARSSEYSRDLAMIWVSPIGMWILQPRLNKLVKGSGNES